MKTILSHLRFLRPLRSLVVVAFYALVSHIWAKNWFGLPPAETQLFVWTVSLPLLGGLFIAAAAHEPMHRKFAFLVPGLRQRQRRAAMIDCLVLALAVTAVVIGRIETTLSPLGVFGLAFGLSAVLSADCRQLWGGTASAISSLVFWGAAGVFGGALLGPLLRQAPLAVFALGVVIGALGLVRGFSREAARLRAGTLFVAWQTGVFSHLFRRGMLQAWQAEVLAHRQLRTKAQPGQNWSAAQFTATVAGWRAALWHAQFGARGQRGTFLAVQLTLALSCVAGAVAGTTAIRLIEAPGDLWAMLAQCVAPDLLTASSSAGVGGKGFLGMLLPAFVAFAAVIQLTPQIPYPLSRRMLARVAFSHALRQWTTALTLPALGLYLVSLTGQLVSGQIRPGYGLPALIGVMLPLGALLPWVMTCATMRAPWARIATTTVLVVAMLLISILPPWRDAFVSGTGVAVSCAIGALGFAWLRQRLRGDYATTDLSRRPPSLIPTLG